MEQVYHVKKWTPKNPVKVTVPGSKSITNRALMLAAMSSCVCTLDGVLFSDDSRAFLSCLQGLGFTVNIEEESRQVIIHGAGGRIPKDNAVINVRSAGTAARFLTVMLSLAGGDYELRSSEQMAKRPMQPLLSILEDAGVNIEYLGEPGHFPFILHSHNLHIKNVKIDTSVSSQFASALLMAGCLLQKGLTVTTTGSRTDGSYIKMTLAIMKQFGVRFTETALSDNEKAYTVMGGQSFGIEHFLIEPDLSGAAYFYSLAPLFGIDVLVYNVHLNSLQGDIKYVELLSELGCVLQDTKKGLWLKGGGLSNYSGRTVDMKDFSDQSITFAVVSVFADTVTEIVNIGHIRFQETDRIAAILNELTRMGIRCEEIHTQEGIRIYPGTPKPALIQTYDDHRMAMAFTLAGMKRGDIDIDNPGCCAKTFENYFELIEKLY